MARIDLGEQVVVLSTQTETVELLLEPEFRRHREEYSGTDIDGFTSDSDNLPSSPSEDDSEN